MNSRYAETVLQLLLLKSHHADQLTLKSKQDKNGLWNGFDYRHLVSSSMPIINFKGELCKNYHGVRSKANARYIEMGNEKEVDPLSHSKSAVVYICYWFLYTSFNIRVRRRRWTSQNTYAVQCTQLTNFFADDRSSEVALSRPLGIKFLRLLMCYAAAIGAGNIKQS